MNKYLNKFFIQVYTRPQIHRQFLLRRTFLQHTNKQHKNVAIILNKIFWIILLLSSFFFSVSAQTNVCIKFIHTANGKNILQDDSSYINAFGEHYGITKLKYYISDLSFKRKSDAVSLVDAFRKDSIEIGIEPGIYEGLSFIVGVDSLKNCSGAQDGDLDALNDMFWTWNSGYVMFKLEGFSDSSGADQQRIEHHIGGYKGIYKTMRLVQIKFPQAMNAEKNKSYRITIEMDLDKYWKSKNAIRINDRAVIVTPGSIASAAADNFPELFTIKYIEKTP